MIYVLAHTPHAEPWITTRPRLYAYPKVPDVSGDALVLLDSGAFGLSLRGQRINDTHMVKLADHYRQHTGGHVIPIAPDEFLNPSRSMSNFEHWHEHHAIPVAPVIQMRHERHFDAMSAQRQLAFYKTYPLPLFAGRPVMCFSNAAWRAIEFERHASGLRLALRMHFPAGVWLHNLGAGWDLHDIRAWAALDIFSSIDSIAWYTDADAGKAWGPGDDIYRANADAAQNRKS